MVKIALVSDIRNWPDMLPAQDFIVMAILRPKGRLDPRFTLSGTSYGTKGVDG